MKIFFVLLFCLLLPHLLHLLATFLCQIALKKKIPFFTPFTMIPIFNFFTLGMYIGVVICLMEIRSIKTKIYSSIDQKL